MALQEIDEGLLDGDFITHLENYRVVAQAYELLGKGELIADQDTKNLIYEKINKL